MHAKSVPHPVAVKGLFSGHIQPYRVSAALQAEPGAQRFVQDVLLVSEATADIGLDHPDLPAVQAQRLRYDPSHHVRNLRGGHQTNPLFPHLGKADEVFDVAVLHGLGFIPALHLDKPGLGGRRCIIPVPDLRMLQDIAWISAVQLRCAILHGLLHIHHEGVFLVPDFDQVQSPGRRQRVLGHHRPDVIPAKADHIRQDQPVLNIPEFGIRYPSHNNAFPSGRSRLEF